MEATNLDVLGPSTTWLSSSDRQANFSGEMASEWTSLVASRPWHP